MMIEMVRGRREEEERGRVELTRNAGRDPGRLRRDENAAE